MTERVVNFSAGPGVLPLPVLERARDELVSLEGVGASPLEVSHRGRWFTDVIERAREDLRTLLEIPDTHHVLFCQGGASMQFSMVPMNLLRGHPHAADHVITGAWGEKAIAEAAKEGSTTIGVVRPRRWLRPGPRRRGAGRRARRPTPPYVHLTTNETIQGVRFPAIPRRRRGAARRRRVERLPLPADRRVAVRPALRRRPEERRTRRRDGRHRPRRRARDGARRPAVAARLPDLRRARLPLQHAAGVRDLRPRSGDALARGRRRRARGDARAEPRQGRGALRRRSTPRAASTVATPCPRLAP